LKDFSEHSNKVIFLHLRLSNHKGAKKEDQGILSLFSKDFKSIINNKSLRRE